MKKKILCLSRSYLSKLFPTIAKQDTGREYYHIVQNSTEEKRVRALGGEVVLNIETLVRSSLESGSNQKEWCEPDDFRNVTGFDWSPVYTDRFLLNLPEAIRLKVAGTLYQGIANLFSKHKFDYFISEPVALFTTHLLFYFCKKNQTNPRLWVNCYFPDNFFFSSALDYSHPNKRDEPRSENEIKESDALIEKFCSGVVEDKSGPAYHFSFSNEAVNKLNYFKQRVGGASLVLTPGIGTILIQVLRLARSFFYKTMFPTKGDFQSAASFDENLFYLKCLMTSRSYYDSLPVSSDANAVTYPLQYEPEASLLYAAPDFFKQLAFVETILRSLPHGKILYVKEHPNQFGALGVKEWRSLRKKYHNVRYIYGRESGRKLIKNSSLIVAISSTAGMDGVLFGKPVLVAGRVFFDDYPNVTRIKSYKELPELLRNPPMNFTQEAAMTEIVKHFKELAKDSYLGDPQPSAVLYKKDNMARLVKAISTECN